MDGAASIAHDDVDGMHGAPRSHLLHSERIVITVGAGWPGHGWNIRLAAPLHNQHEHEKPDEKQSPEAGDTTAQLVAAAWTDSRLFAHLIPARIADVMRHCWKSALIAEGFAVAGDSDRAVFISARPCEIRLARVA